MHKFKTFLTVGDLKKIIANMADDAVVSARDRDCISLDQVHVVGYTGVAPILEGKASQVQFCSKMEDVYGGDRCELDNNSKQAIIFCDCD